MSRLLVLGSRETAANWTRSLRRLPRRPREGVLVVNDRTPQAAAHLDRALRLKQQNPALPVAVLTLVESGDPRGAQLERRQAGAILDGLHAQMSMQVKEGVLTFEYAG